jgi:flagellar basal-body rod protein FlgC
MVNPVSIALSGLNAASTKLAAAASNIANASTTGAREGNEGPKAYTPVDVVEISGDFGVKAETVKRNPATTPAYQPDAPYADAQGFVDAPTVDLTTEIVNSKQAALAYKANAAVIRVSNQLDDELFSTLDERA